MTFLLSNDDGIEAPGLAALLAATEGLGRAVVVAPAGPQSGMSHAITWDRPVRLERRAADRFAVHGTPADCARLGLLRAVPEASWVLSGINFGGNLGADVHYSGTVAAVREAGLHGWPGIAFSQYKRAHVRLDWASSTRWVATLLPALLAHPVVPGLFYNVNLPHLDPGTAEPEVVFCRLDPGPLPLSYRHESAEHHQYDGDYHNRPRQPGSDVDVCFGGRISVTEMRLF